MRRAVTIVVSALGILPACRVAMPEEFAMNPRLFRVIVPVADVERATTFYSIVLGTEGMRVSNGRHYFDCGGTVLACFDPRADGDDFDPRPNPEWLYFAVSDIDATYRACKRAGAEFAPGDVHGDPAAEIAVRPWGEKSFYVHDPFGNKLCFVDRKTAYFGDRPGEAD